MIRLVSWDLEGLRSWILFILKFMTIKHCPFGFSPILHNVLQVILLKIDLWFFNIDAATFSGLWTYKWLIYIDFFGFPIALSFQPLLNSRNIPSVCCRTCGEKCDQNLTGLPPVLVDDDMWLGIQGHVMSIDLSLIIIDLQFMGPTLSPYCP